MDGGKQVERLDPSRLMMLVDAFDLIIIGSRAHEDFYARMKHALSRGAKKKFIFYSRSFFDRFTRTQDLSGPVNDRDEGWKEILRANSIVFVLKTHMMTANYKYEDVYFQWNLLRHFVRDKRVTVLGEETPPKPGEE